MDLFSDENITEMVDIIHNLTEEDVKELELRGIIKPLTEDDMKQWKNGGNVELIKMIFR
jgi:hypothetical protein